MHSRLADARYVQKLAERNELLVIDNIAVDAPNLVLRRFACDTRHCVRVEERNGRPWFCGSCCTDLVVELAEPERERLERLASVYLRRFPRGLRSVRAVAQKIRGGEIIAYSQKDEPILDDLHTNRCVLSYLDRQGVLRCTVNTMVEALGLRSEDYKPDACLAFPIHYVDYEPDRWFVTVINRQNYRPLGVARETASVRCLTRPLRDAPPAYVTLRRELEHLWGKRFWQQLDHHARRLLGTNAQPNPKQRLLVPGT